MCVTSVCVHLTVDIHAINCERQKYIHNTIVNTNIVREKESLNTHHSDFNWIQFFKYEKTHRVNRHTESSRVCRSSTSAVSIFQTEFFFFLNFSFASTKRHKHEILLNKNIFCCQNVSLFLMKFYKNNKIL